MMAQTALDRHAPSEQPEETYALENHPCHRTARFRELRQSIRRQQRPEQIATNARSRVPQVLSGFPSRPAWPWTVRSTEPKPQVESAHITDPPLNVHANTSDLVKCLNPDHCVAEAGSTRAS